MGVCSVGLVRRGVSLGLIAVLAVLSQSDGEAAGKRRGKHTRTKARTKFVAAAPLAAMAPGSPTGPPLGPPMAPRVPVDDPAEGLNRGIAAFNDGVYVVALRPAARGWKAVVGERGTRVFGNFFMNLGTPASALNAVAQGRPRVAADEVRRFGINTTAGVLGFHDVAADCYGIGAADLDFGLTLARYGADTGPAVQLPLLGPSSVRDGVGTVVDIATGNFTNPVGGAALVAPRVVNQIAIRYPMIDRIRAESPDPYVAFRDGAAARRESAVDALSLESIPARPAR